MLQREESLETWALDELPRDWQSLPAAKGALQFATSNSIAVERLADHRLAYLAYEGPVSGDRGTVRQLDAGTYSVGKNPQVFDLAGHSIRGLIELCQLLESGAWQLTFTPAQS